MTGSRTLVAAGAGIVAVTYGLARYGYGLLLPDIRADLGASSATLGFVATASIAAYLAATAISGAVDARVGPRPLVVAGGTLAVAGMLVVAAAHSVAALAAGIAVAGASSGLAYPPLAAVMQRTEPATRRGRRLAVVSAGTGWGVLLATAIALAAGHGWRVAWLLFAVAAAVATAWATVALSHVQRVEPERAERLRPSWFVCSRSGPLLAGALLVGIGSSVYWTFAVDLVAREGGASPSSARLVLALVGAASLVGALSGAFLDRIGGRATLVGAATAMAAALAALAVAPGSWLAVVPSALLFGAAYNVVAAVQAVWSTRVFAGRPATGVAAVTFVLASGILVGPSLAGLLAQAAGMPAAFLAGAVVVAGTVLLLPREELSEQRTLAATT